MQGTTTQKGAGSAGFDTTGRVKALDTAPALIHTTHGRRRMAGASVAPCPPDPGLRGCRARLFRPFLILALLLGALPFPAAAQTPATPASLWTSAGSAAFTVGWKPVSGAKSYVIEWDATTETGFGNTAVATPGAARRKTIRHTSAEPVVNGTRYKVQVRACSDTDPLNAAMPDCSGRTTTLRVTPGTPARIASFSIGPYFVASQKMLYVEWDDVTANGSPVTGWDVHYTTSWNHSRDAAAVAVYHTDRGLNVTHPDPSSGWVEIRRWPRTGKQRGEFIPNLPYGLYYRVRMRAVNAIGAGEWRETGYVLVEQVRAPNIARNVRIEPGDGKLTLRWEAPSRWGSWPAGGYEIRWRLSSAGAACPPIGDDREPSACVALWAPVWKNGAAVAIGPGATSFEFSGTQQGSVTVTNGTSYDLRIRGWNKRPGTDGSAANDRRATPIWYPHKISGTPSAPPQHWLGQQAPGRRLVPPALHGDLLDQVYGWREDPNWRTYKEHTDRWDRVLLAFGERVSDTSLTPMTASEAQGYVDDRGWTRWVSVAEALRAVVTGTSGADTLRGTTSGELLAGLGGADTLNGQGGNDELRGGDGDDDLSGGGGADRFVLFGGETGANAITDFESGDVIVLKGSGWSSAASIIASVQAVGTANYRYTLAPGLTVETTNNRTLRTEDFVTD